MFDPFSIFINIVISVVLSLASTLLQQAFAPKPSERQQQTGTRGALQTGGKVSQYFLVGTVGESGKLEYGNEWGTVNGAPNAYAVDVFSFGDLPITAMTKLYVYGVEEPLTSSGAIDAGFPATGAKAGVLWAQFYDGTQTVASPYLLDKFGADPDRPWLSDMIGRGVPYLILTALWEKDRWTGLPTTNYTAEFQGIKLYDPRKDSTAGGVGSQRWSDPSTWTFSDNNMVIIYNFYRGIYYGGAHLWGGTKTAAQLPYTEWSAAMDACDESVALSGGGTEKRFRGGRRVSFNDVPADVIMEFLIGCNGRIIACADGSVYPLVGVPEEADGVFTDADVLASNALGTIPWPNLDNIINGATATYREPVQAWGDKETAPYIRSDFVEEDDGRENIQGLDLGTTFSGTQAQRILKAVIEEGRRFRKHVVVLPPVFAQYRPLQILEWTSDRFDYTSKKFLITTRTVEPFGRVILGLTEIDPTDHAWSPSDQQPLSFAPVVTNQPAPQEVSGFYVTPAVVVDSNGVSRRPAIDVFWSATSVTVDVRAVRISVRLAEDESLVWDGEAPRPELGSARLTEALLPNEAYEVQIQYVPFSGRVTVESSWLPVTTPDVKLGANDIAIDLSAVAKNVLSQISTNRQVIEAFKRIGTLLEEADRENYTKRESLFREIQVELDGLQASFTEIIEVALDPEGSSALAIAIQQLRAAMGGNSSEINVRWDVLASPEGMSARYAIQAAVNDGTFRAATLFLDVPEDTDQPTRIGLMAGQTAFFTSDGIPIGVISEDGYFKSANEAISINMLTGDLVSTGNFSFGE